MAKWLANWRAGSESEFEKAVGMVLAMGEGQGEILQLLIDRQNAMLEAHGALVGWVAGIMRSGGAGEDIIDRMLVEQQIVMAKFDVVLEAIQATREAHHDGGAS